MSATFEVSWTDFTTNCQRVTQLKGSAIYLLEMRKFLEMSFGDGLSHRLANFSTKLIDLPGVTWMCFPFSNTGLSCWW